MDDNPMNHKSDKQCEAVSAYAVDKPRCPKGALYHYRGQDLCATHFQKVVTDDYIAAHPECVRATKIKIGKSERTVTPEQMAQIIAILR